MNFFSDYILSTKDKEFFFISWSGGNMVCSNEKNLVNLVGKLDYRNYKEILEQYLLFIQEEDPDDYDDGKFYYEYYKELLL
jgi:hypothetical protein